jgi:hypothetical protein
VGDVGRKTFLFCRTVGVAQVVFGCSLGEEETSGRPVRYS